MIMEINDAIDDCVERLFLMVVVIRMRVLLSANYWCILQLMVWNPLHILSLGGIWDGMKHNMRYLLRLRWVFIQCCVLHSCMGRGFNMHSHKSCVNTNT